MTYMLVNWFVNLSPDRWRLEKLNSILIEFRPQETFIIITKEEYELFEQNPWILE